MFVFPKDKKITYPCISYGTCHKTILFTNARDESHIKEWVAHHLLLGFDMVYIFDHKSEIPLKKELHGMDPRVFVERCEMDGPVKIPLMQKAVAFAQKKKYDWMLYLDADEFLILNQTNDVKNLLNRFQPVHMLSINWLMFGSNYHVKEPDGLMIENYTRSDSVLCDHVKSFVRPNEVLKCGNPHFYIIRHPEKNASIDFKRMNSNPDFAHSNPTDKTYKEVIAFVAHYMYQSEENYYKRKIMKPRDDNGTYRGGKRDDLKKIHAFHNNFVNTDVKDKYANPIRKFLLFFENKKNKDFYKTLSLPDESKALPDESKALPDESKALPDESKET